MDEKHEAALLAGGAGAAGDAELQSANARLSQQIAARERAEQGLRRTNRALRVLSASNQVLVRATDEASLLQEVCRIAVEIGGYRMAWIGVAERDEGRTVRPVAWAGHVDGYLDALGASWGDTERGRMGAAGPAIRTGRPGIVRDTGTDSGFAPWRADSRKRGYASVMSLPVPAGDDQPFGALTLCSSAVDAFDAEEVSLLEELASDLAFGIISLRTKAERQRAEEALRDSETRYRTLVETFPDGVVLTDLAGSIIFGNRQAAAMFGYETPEEILGCRALDFAAPEDRARLREDLTRVSDVGSRHGVEYLALRRDGERLPVEVSGSVLPGPDGSPIAAVALIRNVTERKRAEERATRIARMYRMLGIAGEAMIRRREQAALFREVCRAVVEEGGFESAWVALIDGSTGKLHLVAQWGAPAALPMAAACSAAEVRDGRLGASSFLPLWSNTRAVGALGVGAPRGLPLDSEEISLLEELAASLSLAIESLAEEDQRKRAEEELARSVTRLSKAMEGTVQAMAATTEVRDPYTAGHQRRVSHLACAIARDLGLAEDFVTGLRMAATIHDLGKICVPAEILSKPGRISAVEFSMIKAHPQVAYDILKPIEFPWPVAQAVAQHHERLDGSGYPLGLSGDDIIQEARILAVADVVEAMSSHRPYRPALGIEKALEEISSGSGTAYDPDVVGSCVRLVRERGFKFE